MNCTTSRLTCWYKKSRSRFQEIRLQWNNGGMEFKSSKAYRKYYYLPLPNNFQLLIFFQFQVKCPLVIPIPNIFYFLVELTGHAEGLPASLIQPIRSGDWSSQKVTSSYQMWPCIVVSLVLKLCSQLPALCTERERETLQAGNERQLLLALLWGVP